MVFKRILNDLNNSSKETVSKVSEVFLSTADSVSGLIGNLPFIATVEKGEENLEYDEKHFFLVPYRLNDGGYTLHSMRVLPNGFGPINDLPKKRIFHFPYEGAESLVEELFLQGVASDVKSSNLNGELSPGSKLINIANEIDRAESKITGGVLLVGGLVAIVNPLAGAGLALSALLPILGGKLSSSGFKSWGERRNKKALDKEIQSAQAKLLSDFKDCETSYEVNSLLAELEVALKTTADQYRPDPQAISDSSRIDFHTTRLTCKAIYDVYLDVMRSKKLQSKALIGTEDIEWMNEVARLATDKREDIIEHKITLLGTKAKSVRTKLEKRGQQETIDHLAYIEKNLSIGLRLRNIARSKYQLVDQMATELLPTAIDAYSVLNEDADIKYLESGRTGEELFVQQVATIRESLDAIISDSKASEVRTLEIQMRYINELLTPQTRVD